MLVICGLAAALGLYLWLVLADQPRADAMVRFFARWRPAYADQPPWWLRVEGLRGWGKRTLDGWVWDRIWPPAPATHWALMIALAASLIGWVVLVERWDWRAPREGKHVLGLAGLVILANALELGALYLKAPNPFEFLGDRINDGGFTGYFSTAATTPDLRFLLSHYAEALRAPWVWSSNVMPRQPITLCGHCFGHPPSPIVAFWVPLQMAKALPGLWSNGLTAFVRGVLGVHLSLSQPRLLVVVGMGELILLGAALAVVPCYGLARLVAGRGMALRLAALGVTLPGLLLVSPQFDQCYGTLTALLLLLVLWGRRAQTSVAAVLRGALLGAVWAIGLSFTLALWVLAIPMALLAVFFGPRVSLSRLAAGVAGVLLAFLVGWFVVWAFWNIDVIGVVRACFANHLGGAPHDARPYGPWLLFNLTAFVQSLGLPLAVVSLALFSRRAMGETLGRGEPGEGKWFADPVRLGGAIFWGVVVLLDVTGAVRGEVGRLWIFLMPLALPGLYAAFGDGRIRGRAVLGLIGAQLAVCVAIGGSWLTG